MTSYVSQVSKSSLVKGLVYIPGILTTHVRAREARPRRRRVRVVAHGRRTRRNTATVHS